MRWGELIITGIAACLSLLFFTIVSEDYGPFAMNMAEGQFCDFSLIDYYYLALIGITPFLKFLYHSFPAFNWMGAVYMLFEIMALFLVLVSIRKTIPNESQNILLVRVIQVLIALFSIDSFLSLYHTRASLILCGIGLFNLAFFQDLRKKDVFWFSIVFVFGMLIRPESSVGMLLFVSVGYFIFNPGLLHLLKRFAIPFFSTAVLFAGFAIDWMQTDIFIRKIEPEIEYNIIIKNLVDISEMKSAEDSVKYQVAASGMWFDPNVVTPEFMRSLILPGLRFNLDLVGTGLQRLINLYRCYPFYFAALIVLLGLSAFHLKSKGIFFKILLFQLFTFILMYYLAFRALLGERHFFGFLVISFLISLYYLSHAYSSQLKISKPPLAAAILIIIATTASLALTIIKYKDKNDLEATKLECYENAMQEIEKSHSGRIIVIPTGSFYLLDQPVSIRNALYSNNIYLLYDAFNYSLYPRYIKYLGRLCACRADNPVEFFKWLSDNNALYIAEPARFDLTQKYMSVVHKKDVKFEDATGVMMHQCLDNTMLRDLRIRSIKAESASSSP